MSCDFRSAQANPFRQMLGEPLNSPDVPAGVGIFRFAGDGEHVDRVEVRQAKVFGALADFLLQRFGIALQLHRVFERVVADLREQLHVFPQRGFGAFLRGDLENRDDVQIVQRCRQRPGRHHRLAQACR